jgi:hypothetical protein
LTKFGHSYHDEAGQPFSEHGLITTDNELVSETKLLSNEIQIYQAIHC